MRSCYYCYCRCETGKVRETVINYAGNNGAEGPQQRLGKEGERMEESN